jgi:hypothetical protein
MRIIAIILLLINFNIILCETDSTNMPDNTNQNIMKTLNSHQTGIIVIGRVTGAILIALVVFFILLFMKRVQTFKF